MINVHGFGRRLGWCDFVCLRWFCGGFFSGFFSMKGDFGRVGGVFRRYGSLCRLLVVLGLKFVEDLTELFESLRTRFLKELCEW